MSDIEKLQREIEELERQIAAHPFEGLFNRKHADQLYHKLKKRRKQLAQMQGLAPAPVAPPIQRTESAETEPARSAASHKIPAPAPATPRVPKSGAGKTKPKVGATSKAGGSKTKAKPKAKPTPSKTRAGAPKTKTPKKPATRSKSPAGKAKRK